MKIGFVGLGAMGLPITNRLIMANYEVYVNDIAEAAMDKAVANGAIKCYSIAELASKVGILFLSLPNANIIQNVLNDILDTDLIKIQVVVDLSSVMPESSQRFAGQLDERNIKYIDCPISGGVSGAVEGTLTMMAGGNSKTIEKLMPIFKAIGKNIYHVGGVSSGSSIKMINNYIMGCTMASVAEALVLGAKLGISLDIMYEIIKVSSGRSFIIENKIPNFISKREFEGGFAVDLAYKDLNLFLETANNQKMPTLMGSTATQIFEMARAKGFGKQDITSLLKIWEELIGVEVK